MTALRELDGEPGVALLDAPFALDDERSAWAIPLGLTIDAHSDLVPSYTEWYAILDASYPLGGLSLFPAASDSIETTFAHQNANFKSKTRPWREGRLCLDDQTGVLLGAAAAGQPTSASERLAWHVASAREWLALAATNRLTQAADPFEMPPFALSRSDLDLLYAEDAMTFASWGDAGFGTRRTVWGRAELRELPSGMLIVERFVTRERTIRPPWGVRVRDAQKRTALWLMLAAVPFVRAYETPLTWGQLRDIAERDGLRFEGELRSIIDAARENADPTILLVGFPIPEVQGGPPIEIAWQSLMLPTFTDARRFNRKTCWRVDRKVKLGDCVELAWGRTQNVSDAHLGVRGELPSALRALRIAIVGIGALGSMIADLLVRMGCRDLTLFDDERLEIVNTRRHVLSVDDVGDYKATALAKRLNSLSLFADVDGVVAALPDHDAEQAITTKELVIDCTAEDDVVSVLSRSGGPERLWFSFSLSAHATEMFCFMNHGEALLGTTFWAESAEFEMRSGQTLRERPATRDPGCHNPTFPAPYDRILRLATRAVAFVVENLDAPVSSMMCRTLNAE